MLTVLPYLQFFVPLLCLVLCIRVIYCSKLLRQASNARSYMLIGTVTMLFYKIVLFLGTIMMSFYSYDIFIRFDVFAQYFPILNIVSITLITVGIVAFHKYKFE